LKSTSIANRLLTGGILGSVSTVCHIVVAFFLMPFIIHSLGDRLYGFWTIMVTFTGYYGFLDFGLASATGRYVAKAIGRNSIDETNVAINTSLILYCYIGIVAILITIAAAALSSFFITNSEEARIFRIVILILGPSLAFGFPARAFAGVLTGYLRYDLTTFSSLSKLLLRTGSILIALNAGYGIISLALITSFADLFAYSFTFYFSRRIFVELNIGKRLFSINLMKELLNYSFKSLIAQVADILRFRVDSFVIAGFLNLQLVTHYTIASRLNDYFLKFITSIMETILPVFSQQAGRSDYESIKKTLIFSTRIASILTIFIGGTIIIVGKVFIIRWMGQDYIDAYPIVVVLTICIATDLMQTTSLSMLYGIAKHGYFAFANISEGLCNLILSIILVNEYGILGVALGTAIPMIFFKLVIQPVYACKQISIPIHEYYLQTIIPAIAILGSSMLILKYMSILFLSPSYSSIVLCVLCGGLFYFFIAFFFFFRKEERIYFYDYIKNICLKKQ
jgi:O-antigen/teichoic acid export membrane protein